MVTTHRVVPDPRPGLSALAELVDDPADLDELIALRGMTNPLVRDAFQAIALVAPKDRYTGAHAAVVMAPFLKLGPSRFSPGTFGVLYVAESLVTAVYESAYHATRLLRASHHQHPTTIQRIAITMKLDDRGLIDCRSAASNVNAAIYDATDYRAAQRLGHDLRAAGHDGICYDSVRRTGGVCYAVFRPRSIRSVEDEGSELHLAWNGHTIESYSIVKTHYLSQPQSHEGP